MKELSVAQRIVYTYLNHLVLFLINVYSDILAVKSLIRRGF